jgi:alpha-glucoside transport system permease protein
LAIAIPATLIPISIAALAAYAFAWIPFKGRGVLFVFVFSLQIVPIQMALVPLLSLFSRGLTIAGGGIFPGFSLRGVDHSFATVWIAHAIFAMPLAIFLLHNFISEIPGELIEAARVDGAGHGQIFFRMIIPLAMPAIASFAIFQFLWVWNDLLVATIFAPSASLPLTQTLNSLSGTVPAVGGNVHLDRGAADRVLRAAALLRARAPGRRHEGLTQRRPSSRTGRSRNSRTVRPDSRS